MLCKSLIFYFHVGLSSFGRTDAKIGKFGYLRNLVHFVSKFLQTIQKGKPFEKFKRKISNHFRATRISTNKLISLILISSNTIILNAKYIPPSSLVSYFPQKIEATYVIMYFFSLTTQRNRVTVLLTNITRALR